VKGLNIQTNDYQLGFQNAMVAFQRQLSLRNRDVIISKPQENENQTKASTSMLEGNKEQFQINPRSGKGKNIIVNQPKIYKEKLPDKHVVNKEQQKNKVLTQEPPKRILESRREMDLLNQQQDHSVLNQRWLK